MHIALDALASIGCTAASSAVTAAILYRGLLTFPEGQAFLRTGTIPETFPSPVSLSPDLSTFDSVCTLIWLASTSWVAWKLWDSLNHRNVIAATKKKKSEIGGATTSDDGGDYDKQPQHNRPGRENHMRPSTLWSSGFQRQMLLYTGVMVPWSVLRFLPSTLILQVVCLSLTSTAQLMFRYIYNVRSADYDRPTRTSTTTTKKATGMVWVWAARANLLMIAVFNASLLWLHYAFQGRFPAGYLSLSVIPPYALSAVTWTIVLVRFHLASRKVFWAAFGNVIALTVPSLLAVGYCMTQEGWGLSDMLNFFISAGCIIDGLLLVPPYATAAKIMDDDLPPSRATTTECASSVEGAMSKGWWAPLVIALVSAALFVCTEVTNFFQHVRPI